MLTEPSPAPGAPSDPRPLLVLLHFLGGSARSWRWVIPALAGAFECRPVDLAGFGDAAAAKGYGLDQMADAVAEIVRAAAPPTWVIAGHSMGAKVAALVARRAEDGEAGLAGLSHIVLLAGSPPGPEPMDEERRTQMRGWFAGDAAARRAQAQAYIDKNVGKALAPDLNDTALEDVLRLDRAAWQAWLDHGSREDRADRIGRLQVPALIVAGEQDGDLGPAAQARLTAPHCAAARLAILPGARHLLPLERPAEIARLILDHTGGRSGGEPAIPPDYRALIDTDRVSARTRAVLLARARPATPADRPQAMTEVALDILRAVVNRVLPQAGGNPIDLAGRIDKALAEGPGDGWRFALLPPDREAYAAALRTLDTAARETFGQSYAALDGPRQDALLETMAQGGLEVAPAGDAPALLSATAMTLWFQDLRGAVVQAYVAHPATLARIGYSGIANGGDQDRKQGFVAVGAGQREPWEPQPAGAPAT